LRDTDADWGAQNNRVNKNVWVKLKWGDTEYKGRLVSCVLPCPTTPSVASELLPVAN